MFSKINSIAQVGQYGSRYDTVDISSISCMLVWR